MLLAYFPLLLAASVAAKPISPLDMTDGFTNPQIIQSAGGKATCVAGTVRVRASATNTKLLYTGPANQMSATETIVELLQVNSDFATKANGGPADVTGTFDIYSKLCYPSNKTALSTVKTIQFLTHGATLDLNYWDIAPDYSYVDAAANAGYASFSYDRLGTGKSQHPDPIQIVQAALQLQIYHSLIQSLRTGSLGGKAFQTVVGVGHSAGSSFTQGITSAFSKDFDAVILSGTSSTPAYIGTATAAFDLTIANTDPSGNFKGIANGYLTQANSIGIQFAFWRYPFFDPNVFAKFVALKQTNTLGELLTLASIISPSVQFTGPVDVQLGENDFVFCGGNCNYPTNQAAPVIAIFYPAASKGSQTYIVPNAGHNIVGHQSTSLAFAQMIRFLQTNGIN